MSHSELMSGSNERKWEPGVQGGVSSPGVMLEQARRECDLDRHPGPLRSSEIVCVCLTSVKKGTNRGAVAVFKSQGAGAVFKSL